MLPVIVVFVVFVVIVVFVVVLRNTGPVVHVQEGTVTLRESIPLVLWRIEGVELELWQVPRV